MNERFNLPQHEDFPASGHPADRPDLFDALYALQGTLNHPLEEALEAERQAERVCEEKLFRR
jgi:hypothetical protein